MSSRSILHMLDPMPHVSPFDINMAADSGFDHIFTYEDVELEQVHGLVQDVIFSRSPAGIKQTALFIGGRDISLATSMLKIAEKAMVPPFVVSVLADPSGAFTTAGALVACAEKELKEKHNTELEGCNLVIIGGTGAVGIAAGVISSLHGVNVTLVDHMSIETALQTAEKYNTLYGTSMKGTCAASDADKARLIKNADLVFCTAKAGVEVLNASVLDDAEKLKVAVDINAVPPLGIEGVKRKHLGDPLIHATRAKGAVGIGALAVGDVKYKLQHLLLQELLESEEPLYLDFRKAFEEARTLV